MFESDNSRRIPHVWRVAIVSSDRGAAAVVRVSYPGVHRTDGPTLSKIGYANLQLIAENMPETRQMQAELASLGGQLENQLKAKYELYSEELSNYEHPSPNEEAESQNKKRQQLIRLENEIRKFSADAELIYLKKQEELMRPIRLRIDKTIQDVANDNNYSIIINTDLPAGQRLVLLGIKEYDISELVLKRMGLSVNPEKR